MCARTLMRRGWIAWKTGALPVQFQTSGYVLTTGVGHTSDEVWGVKREENLTTPPPIPISRRAQRWLDSLSFHLRLQTVGHKSHRCFSFWVHALCEMSSDNTLLNMSSVSVSACVCVCVCVRVRDQYDFRLHESISSVFEHLTLTHTVRQKGWLWGVAGNERGEVLRIPASSPQWFRWWAVFRPVRKTPKTAQLLVAVLNNQISCSRRARTTLRLADVLRWLPVHTGRESQN